MFISFEQLVILLLLAFILFGPEKLPEIAEKLGRLVAKVRQASSELTQQLHQPLENPLEPPQLTKRLACPQCQQTVVPDFAYCPRCGHHLQKGPGPERLGG